MGWVEDLPSGRHRGVARNPITGRRWSKTHDRWAEADAWWRAEERTADTSYTTAGIEVTRQHRDIPLWRDHVTDWAALGTDDAEIGTLLGYRSHARQLAARWPTERVTDITEDMIRRYLAELRDHGLAPSTRTLRLTVIRHALRAAVRAGYRSDDPTVGIKGPKPREHQARILTEPELLRLVNCFADWLAPAVLLSHDAGLRIDEIAGLRVCNLDLLHGVVTIVDIIEVNGDLRHYPKSKIIRDVPLSQRVLVALRDHFRDQPPAGMLAPVFGNPDPRKRGRHVRPHRIRDEWDRALVLAQLDGEKPTWHDLRHGCATALADADVSPWIIQAILGHGSVATSQRYVRKASLTRQAAAITAAFDTPAPPPAPTADPPVRAAGMP